MVSTRLSSSSTSMIRRLSIRHRKVNRKRGTAAAATLHAHAPSVVHRDLPHERQAEAAAADPFGRGRAAKKRIEEMRQVVRIDAAAAVVDADRDALLLRRPADADPLAVA